MRSLLTLLFLAAHATVGRAWWGVGNDYQYRDDSQPAKYRIVGGQDVIAPVPWMATIGKVFKGEKIPQHFCGATLIHKDYVMTAAHCLASKELKELVVSIGGLDRSKFSDPMWEHFKVTKSICHPDYVTDTEENDVCLLKLNRSSTKQVAVINTVRMSANDGPNKHEKAGELAAIFGWGTLSEMATTVPEKLQSTLVPLMDLEACKALVPRWQPEKVDARTLCAGFNKGGKDSCAGDSGGPMVMDETVIGISSWGLLGCARPNNPGVYQRVAYFASWIESITGPLGSKQETSKKKAG